MKLYYLKNKPTKLRRIDFNMPKAKLTARQCQIKNKSKRVRINFKARKSKPKAGSSSNTYNVVNKKGRGKRQMQRQRNRYQLQQQQGQQQAVEMVATMQQDVLDFWINQVLEQCLQDKEISLEDVILRRKSMGNSWQSRTPLDLLDYNEETTQYAYVAHDLPYRASFVTELMNSHDQLTAVFDKPLVQIVSIGSGPATEMVGVMNYLHQRALEFTPMIRFLLVDKAPGWSKVIGRFEAVIREDTQLVFEQTFFQHDLSSSWDEGKSLNPLSLLPSCRTADLFIFPLIFSEILKEGTAALHNAARNIKSLFEHAEPGTLFLVIDIDQKGVIREINSALNTIFCPENSERDCRTFRWSLPPFEGPTEAGAETVAGAGHLESTKGLTYGNVYVLMYTKKFPVDYL